MDVALFHFDLPEQLIAQVPATPRDHSRLLVIDRKTGLTEDRYFYDIVHYLNKGDVLVRNNTKVIPARLIGLKPSTGAKVELLLLKSMSTDRYECLVGNAKVVKVGTELTFGDGRLKAICTEVKEDGVRVVQFHYRGIFLEILSQLGDMPLPPYIKQKLVEKDRYQTVFARVPGSAAAPTAGFHFTDALLEKVKALGVEIVDITLHIGLGTFKPMQVKDTQDHKMHEETYIISAEASNALNRAKRERRRIIALGTTACRSLEANLSRYRTFTATEEATALFITPGFTFKAVDALITNFHLPQSTLLMLVSSFYERQAMLNIYRQAVEKQYRFFSFGDAMFIR